MYVFCNTFYICIILYLIKKEKNKIKKKKRKKMGNYYQEKRNAVALIDEMFAKGADINKIYFKVETMFGFGKKIVDNRLALLHHVSQKQPKNKDK